MLNTNFRTQVSGSGWFAGAIGSVLAFLLTTCGPGHGTDCLKSTGKIITQRREVPTGLTQITMYDNVDLLLVQDTVIYAEVRSGENLIDDIEFKLAGNALEIKNTSTCNWARSYDTPREVTLHVPNIENIFLKGAGNISTVGLFRQDRLFLHLVGAGDMEMTLEGAYLNMDMYELGDMTLHGSMDDLAMTLGGNGRLFASDLQTRRCYFQTTRDSNGDAHVRASDALATSAGNSLAGTGTVYYAGSPSTVSIKITGSGQAKAE
jgi:hypothetical protein